MLRFDIKLTQFALKNNLHVEFFIWVYLRSLNNSGFYCLKDLERLNFGANILKTKIRTNCFFEVKDSNIKLNSIKTFQKHLSKNQTKLNFVDIKKFSRRLSVNNKSLIKKLDSTMKIGRAHV